MSGKIRLVGGPLGGKTINYPRPGENRIVVQGKKRMTRKQRYELMRDQYDPAHFGSTFGPVEPMVRAEYELAMRPHTNGYQIMNAPCMHPDGSYFYTYVKGSERTY